jgi:hypothetical protein
MGILMSKISVGQARELFSELSRLSKQQHDSLHTAVHFKISKEEHAAFEQRHNRILEIWSLLAQFTLPS